MTVKSLSKLRMSAQDRRAAILEAASRIFSERGFRGSTTRELAAAAGVTEPVLYEHFRTKSELYAAIIDAKSQEPFRRLVALGELHAESADDTGFFTGLANIILDVFLEDPTYFRIEMFSALEGHDLKDVFHARHKEGLMEFVAPYLARRMAEGGLRPADPKLTAWIFTGMVAHYGLSSMLFACGGQDVTRAEVARQMVAIFLHGIAAPKEAR